MLPRTCVISIKELSKDKACVEALIGRGLVQVLIDISHCLPDQCTYHLLCHHNSSRERSLAIWQAHASLTLTKEGLSAGAWSLDPDE